MMFSAWIGLFILPFFQDECFAAIKCKTLLVRDRRSMPRRFKKMIVRYRPLGQWFKVSPCWLWDKGHIPFLGASDYITWPNAEPGADLPVGKVLEMGELPGCGSRKGERKILSSVKGHQAACSADSKLWHRLTSQRLPSGYVERVCMLGYPGLRTVLQEVSIFNLRR